MKMAVGAVAVAIVAAFVSGTASAADLPLKANAPAYLAPTSAYSWKGLYGGVQGLYGFGEGKTTDAGPVDFTVDSKGGGFGAFAGYNVQLFSNVVAGVEGDINWADIHGTDRDSIGIEYTHRYNWIGSVRGRLGYAFGRMLVFGTGGVAFAGIDHTVNDTPGSTTGLISFHDTYSGWTAGGGIEYALLDNLAARIEYRYYKFSDMTYGNTTAGGGLYFWTPHTFDPNLQTVSLGLSMKF